MMKGEWKEVVKLAFSGERFQDHALDLSAVGELNQFQKLVMETAKALWRAANPQRERLPPHFEQCARLCLRRIEEGSAVAPLEVFLEQPEGELFEPEPFEVTQAVEIARQTYRAAELDQPLPDALPKALVAEYERLGESLFESEEIEITTDKKERARVNRTTRSRLAAFVEPQHEGELDAIGEVLEADIRMGRFQLWLDERTPVTVAFTPEQEDEVTSALRDHRVVRMHVKGKAEFTSQGRPQRITRVDGLRLRPAGEAAYDLTAPAIEDVLAQLAHEVPDEEWKRLPADLTDNLDRHLFGEAER